MQTLETPYYSDWQLICQWLHHNGERTARLTSAQWVTCCTLADGYGKPTAAMVRANPDMYDWSHFRDASAGAIAALGTYLRTLGV